MGIRDYLSQHLRQQRMQTEALQAIQEDMARIRTVNEALLRQSRTVEQYLKRTREVESVVRYALSEKVLHEVTEFSEGRVLDYETTLRRIATEKLSFARFGDGELKLMFNPDYRLSYKGLAYQVGSPGLRRDLRAVLTYEHYSPEKLLVGFPFIFRNAHWQKVWCDVWPRLSEILPRDMEYGVTHVSRPYFFSTMGERAVAMWREVWNGQRVCVITGRGSLFGMVDELFDNVASVDFLYSEPKDAYDDLDRVLAEAAGMEDVDLFLISLGPTATIAAAELSRMGRWAIDIGHLSASYEGALKGAGASDDRPIASGETAAGA